MMTRRCKHGSSTEKNSKTRKAKRRTHYKLVKPALTRCPNCGEYKLAHKMCSCGEYNGKQIVEK